MARKFIIAFFALLVVCLWTITSFGTNNKAKSEKNSPQPTVKASHDVLTEQDIENSIVKETSVPIQQSAGVFKYLPSHPIVTSSPHYDTAGTTYYDYQSNDRLPRQIVLDALGHVHADWMKSVDADLNPREIYYSSWFNAAKPRSAAETQVSLLDSRGGYCAMTALPDGRGVAVYHRVNAVGAQKHGTYMSPETTPSVGDFDNTFHAPDSLVPMTTAAIWADADGQKYKDSMRVHVVWVEGETAGGATRHLGYTRAKETSSGVFSFTPAVMFDTVDGYISPIVVASQKSDKVAIIWSHPRYGIPGISTDADLYYIESHTGGDDWLNGFNNNAGDHFQNITNFVDSDPIRASGDLSAAYDENDSLVVTFFATTWDQVQQTAFVYGYVYFWSKVKGLRKVFDASFPTEGRLTVSSLTADKPMIGVYKGAHPDSIGDYYILFSSVDPTLADTGRNGNLNGDLYVSATTNDGFTWSSAKNITNSQTPACSISTCDSDNWASMAKTINDTMHILYVNDKWPGRGIDEAADATLNPVFYLKQKAFAVGKDTLASVSPNTFIDFCIPLNATKDTTIYIENIGNQDLGITSIVANQPFATATVGAPYGAPPFTILEGGTKATVTLSLNMAGKPCSSYAVTYTITTLAENHNFNNAKGIFTVKLNFVVYTASSPFFTRKTQVVQCGGVLLSISNTGNVGNANDTAGMYIIADTTNFLYEGSEIFAAVMTSGDSVGAHDFHGADQYHPLYNPTTLGDIQVKDTAITDSVSFATALANGRPATPGTWRIARVYYAVYLPSIDTLCPWPGPWFGYWICEQWWWKVTPAPKFKWVIWYKKKIKQGPPCWWPKWPSQPKIVGKIYDGLVCDWDVPSDSAVVNDGAYNDIFKMAYATGRGTPYDQYYGATVFLVDTTKHLKDSTVYDTTGLFAAHVLSNQDLFDYSSYDSWLYYWSAKRGVKHQFAPYEDIHTVTTSICFDTAASSATYAQGLAVTIKGLDSLKATVNEMRRASSLDTLVLTPPCTDFAGDANGSGNISLPDITVLVNFIFKGGAKPNPACRGDCNNSNTITLPDITILVNYIFKGGPKPAKDLDGPCCK